MLRSDNGGEYNSERFTEYLWSEGVTHERKIPRTLELNRVAERLNRTLIEMTRSMVTGSRSSGHRLYLLQPILATAAVLKL